MEKERRRIRQGERARGGREAGASRRDSEAGEIHTVQVEAGCFWMLLDAVLGVSGLDPIRLVNSEK